MTSIAEGSVEKTYYVEPPRALPEFRGLGLIASCFPEARAQVGEMG